MRVTNQQKNTLPLLIAVILAVMILIVFWNVQYFPFINYDDYEYVTENPHVRTGITVDGVLWAFTSFHAANWHPLTWISHMIDCNLYGLNPGGHHFTNLILHILNTLLLLVVLNRMTGTMWRSAWVTALFAIHPLHVESVVWIAERKDVLSTAFWMMTLWCYGSYIEQPGLKRYLIVCLCFILGLLSKPMVVTLPFVLLLLDYWPLSRFQGASIKHADRVVDDGQRPLNSTFPFHILIVEKIPLLILSAASSVITIAAQKSGQAIVEVTRLSIADRIANALVSYCRYLGKMIWPVDLALLYPLAMGNLTLGRIFFSCLFLVAISIIAVRWGRIHGYLSVGWLWFLGTLVPVIGLVQVGLQVMADRYTYIPLIGLFIMVVWALSAVAVRYPPLKRVFSVAGFFILLLLMMQSWRQVQYWGDGITLYQHTIKVTPDNHIAQYNLGSLLAEQGNHEQAIPYYEEAIRIQPNAFRPYINLGNALSRLKRYPEAEQHLLTALTLNPYSTYAHHSLGFLLDMQKKHEEAISHYEAAIRIKPDFPMARINYGRALIGLRRFEEAIEQFSIVIAQNPNNALARYHQGIAYHDMQKDELATREYEELKSLNPALASDLLGRISGNAFFPSR
jgi:Flp pilus assembly protein TadD